jgi:hypothetical protein
MNEKTISITIKVARKISHSIFLLFLLIILIGINCSYAQNVVATSGTSGKGTTVQVDYTVGEPVIETYSSSANILTQGFQQSKLTITAIDQIAGNDFSLKVYPNPVCDQLLVETATGEEKGLLMKLFDLSGKLVFQKPVTQPVESINMKVYENGNYFLTVCFHNDKPLQTFKVIKN